VTEEFQKTSINLYSYGCGVPTIYDVIRTNLQLKVSMNAKFVRNSETKVHGTGPRASHTGPVRVPVITGGDDASTEQSTPR